MRPTLVGALFVAFASNALSQGPFQYAEAHQLRLRMERSGRDYTPQHLRFRPPDDFGDWTRPTAIGVYSDRARLAERLTQIRAYAFSGAFEDSEQMLTEFAERMKQAEGNESSDAAFVYHYIAEIYLERRQFDKAYEYLTQALEERRASEQALAAAERLKDRSALVDAIQKILGARTLNALQARQSWDNAQRTAKDLDQYTAAARALCQTHLADVLTRLGQLDVAKRDPALAASRFKEAIQINSERKYLGYVNRLDPVNAMSLLLESQGKIQEAEALWKRAVELRRSLGNAPYLDATAGMATFYARQGKFREASAAAQTVLAAGPTTIAAQATSAWLPGWRTASITDSEPFEMRLVLTNILAIKSWMSAGPEGAMRYVSEAATYVATLCRDTDVGSDSERLKLLEWLQQSVALDISILLDGEPSSQRANLAYAIVKELKGRYLALRAAAGRSRADPELLNDLARADEMKARLFTSSAFDGTEVEARTLAASETKENSLTAALSKVSLGSADSAEMRSLFSSIPDDAILVDMLLFDRMTRTPEKSSQKQYAAFLLRKNQPADVVLLGSAATMDAGVQKLQSQMALYAYNRGQGLDNFAEVRQSLRELYRLVIYPIETHLSGVRQILIIPDGALALVPVGAFLDASGHYLLERFPVTYLTCWRELLFWRPSVRHATTALLLGNPDFDRSLDGKPGKSRPGGYERFDQLKTSKAEVETLQSVLSWATVRVLLGNEAREAEVKSAKGPALLHFATHSEAMFPFKLPAPKYEMAEFPIAHGFDDPLLRSFVVLAGANRTQTGKEDGILTALEISNLNLLGTRLAVLSSCKSGLGQSVNGQGVLGLRAAFFMAGAEAMVMSLWEVDDLATGTFMKKFYEGIAKSRAEALRSAQLEFIHTRQFKHPFYWAGYALSGDFTGIEDRKFSMTDNFDQYTPSYKQQTVREPARCFEFTGIRFGDNQPVSVHLSIAGAVTRQDLSEHAVRYVLTVPGSDFTVRADGVTAKITEGTLTISQGLRLGTFQLEAQRLRLTLFNPPGLLPNLDVPAELPTGFGLAMPPAFMFNGKRVKLTSFGACRQ